MKKFKPKITIIGAGNVGSTFAYSLMISGLAREIVIVDIDKQKAEGECLDLNHGMNFTSPTKIYSANYDGCKNADIVVITAGAGQKQGQTRLDLVTTNVKIFKSIISQVIRFISGNAIILVVTNPVDILSYVTYKLSGLPSNRVIGSGTVLDTSRLHYLISEHCNVNPKNVHAYIIGEHGDTELAVWSSASIGGVALTKYCSSCPKAKSCNNKGFSLFESSLEEVKSSAYKVISAKGSTCYAIGLALVSIVRAILRDENTILPVSTLINDYFGIQNVYLSIPSVINKLGVDRVLRLSLCDNEREKLRHSANTLKSFIKQTGFL